MTRLLALLDTPADAEGAAPPIATRAGGAPHRPGTLALASAGPLSDDILPTTRRRRR